MPVAGDEEAGVGMRDCAGAVGVVGAEEPGPALTSGEGALDWAGGRRVTDGEGVVCACAVIPPTASAAKSMTLRASNQAIGARCGFD
ncbi:hypothetical protein SDC9_101365 [bioreactor metagenome]|uniref:Uncharacterized protein n=1 Tax=bioreactor metagenome TaxID=1076179 RepID=A0A645ANG6_9ZZZZ